MYLKERMAFVQDLFEMFDWEHSIWTAVFTFLLFVTNASTLRTMQARVSPNAACFDAAVLMDFSNVDANDESSQKVAVKLNSTSNKILRALVDNDPDALPIVARSGN